MDKNGQNGHFRTKMDKMDILGHLYPFIPIYTHLGHPLLTSTNFHLYIWALFKHLNFSMMVKLPRLLTWEGRINDINFFKILMVAVYNCNATFYKFIIHFRPVTLSIHLNALKMLNEYYRCHNLQQSVI
jgi:hypothetical protein